MGRDSFGGVMEWLRENILVQLEKRRSQCINARNGLIIK